jgi:hypothetical protein
MTAPRQILAGTTSLITRRCSVTNEIFLYVLAVAAQRFNVRVHAFCVLSNHYHLVVTDVDARLPEFEQYLDSLVARATNCSLGRFEGFWAAATSYSAVRHTDPEGVVEKVAYTLANPVAAGLVQSGSEWPGLWSAPDQLGGGKLVARRPKVFFREDGHMLDRVELELTTPPGFASARVFRERVSHALSRLEKSIRRERAKDGFTFMGRAKVLRQRPTARPAPGEPRFRMNPRVAGIDKWKRIEAILRLKGFLDEYRAAWLARLSGESGVVFPAGTYHLRVLHGVRCAAAT